MQCNLTYRGKSLEATKTPKRTKKSSIWENLWFKILSPFFRRVFLSSIVDECCPLCQCYPTPCTGCLYLLWPAPSRRKLQLSSFPQRFSAAVAFQTPGERNRAGALRDSRSQWLSNNFLSQPQRLPSLPCVTLIHDRHMRREIIYISDTFEMRLLSTTGTCPGGRQYRSTPKPWDWGKLLILIKIRE